MTKLTTATCPKCGRPTHIAKIGNRAGKKYKCSACHKRVSIGKTSKTFPFCRDCMETVRDVKDHHGHEIVMIPRYIEAKA